MVNWLTLSSGAEGLMAEPPALAAEVNEHDREFDRLLLARIRNGEKEAFAELVRRFQKKIFVLAYGFFHDREDALEIVQETFMRVHAKIHLFRPEHSLQSWIYCLARNLCVDYYRKFARKRMLELDFDSVPGGQLAGAADGHAAWEAQQTADAVERAAAGLSLRQREVFVLKYRQGLKLQQVAETMSISIGTVKALHHRAIKRIRREVAPGAGGEK